jgi:XTP/dITP diphosphohydrolase
MSSMFNLIIATRNAHKAEEIQAILGSTGRCRTLQEYPDAPKVVEDRGTFAGNATKKAVELARWLCSAKQVTSADPVYVLADDSGLEVDALGGAPGVNSARFAALEGSVGENTKDADNNAKLLHLLADVPAAKRSARFRCVMALTPLLSPAPQNASPVCAADELELATTLLEGTCEGRIGFAPAGTGGFGYDPLFIPDGFTQSFAELGEDVKNGISHRARALQALRQALKA